VYLKLYYYNFNPDNYFYCVSMILQLLIFFTEVIKFYWLMLLLYPGELYRLLGASSLNSSIPNSIWHHLCLIPTCFYHNIFHGCSYSLNFLFYTSTPFFITFCFHATSTSAWSFPWFSIRVQYPPRTFSSTLSYSSWNAFFCWLAAFGYSNNQREATLLQNVK
jgi:hypothetical protein